MESTLNLLWLVTAVVAVGVWRLWWRRSSADFFGALALACALLLLFPSISATDDLHPEIVVVDAAAGKRTIQQLLSSAGHGISHATARTPGLHPHAPVAVLSLLVPSNELLFDGLSADNPAFSSQTHLRSHLGRSPPPFIS